MTVSDRVGLGTVVGRFQNIDIELHEFLNEQTISKLNQSIINSKYCIPVLDYFRLQMSFKSFLGVCGSKKKKLR